MRSFFRSTNPPSGVRLLGAHLAEEVHHTGEDNQQDTTTGAQSQHLGDEALVQGAEALLLHDCADRRPGPVVLGGLTGDLGRVLNARLDHVHRCVEDCTGDTTNGTGDQVIARLLALVAGLGGGHLGTDLEDTAKVASVPQDVAPEGRLEAIVHGQWTLLLDDLLDDIQHAIVLASRSLVLQADLDQLEGNNDKGLGSTSRRTGQRRKTLGLLLHAKQIAVEAAPAVIGGELGRTLRRLHQDRSGDTAVKAREAVGNRV